jgi:hypothetical protein
MLGATPERKVVGELSGTVAVGTQTSEYGLPPWFSPVETGRAGENSVAQAAASFRLSQ